MKQYYIYTLITKTPHDVPSFCIEEGFSASTHLNDDMNLSVR